MESNSTNRKKIFFGGMLTGPGCGELNGNLLTCELLSAHSTVVLVDTSLIESADEIDKVGSFSLLKVLKAIFAIGKSYKIIWCDVAYLVPGQTVGGVLRFMFFAIVAKALKKNIVYHFHGSRILDTFRGAKPLVKYFIGRFLSFSDVNFVLTESLKMAFANQLPLPGKIIVLPNCVDTHALRLRKDGCILNVLYFSNFMREKGVFEFVDAAIKLAATNRFHFTLAGGGSLEVVREIEFLIRGCEAISLVGYVSGEEKLKLLEGNDIYVLPTYYPQEGLPISMLECMSYGHAVITCRQGGIPDIINEGVNGLYVPKRDSHSIVNALLCLESDRILLSSISRNNVHSIHSNFSYEHYQRILVNSLNLLP